MGALGNRDFRRLWLADLVSQLGSRIDVLAVPLLAATALGASVFEVSLLRTAETLPYLVLGLQVGAWCDRMRHRPVLIAADLGRAVLIGSIPVPLSLRHAGYRSRAPGIGLTHEFDMATRTELVTDVTARLRASQVMATVAGPGWSSMHSATR